MAVTKELKKFRAFWKKFEKEFPTKELQDAEIKRQAHEEYEANVNREDGTINIDYLMRIFENKLLADKLKVILKGDPSILNKKNPDSPALGTSHKIEGRLGREKK